MTDMSVGATTNTCRENRKTTSIS